MGDDRRFVLGMHYTHRGHTSPHRVGEPKIQFGSMNGGVGSLGDFASTGSEIDREVWAILGTWLQNKTRWQVCYSSFLSLYNG